MDNSLFTDEPLPHESLFTEEPAPKAPQWSDIPGNIVKGIKETPETVKNLVTLPYRAGKGLGESAAAIMEGEPAEKTPAGQVVGQIGQDISSFAEHPLQSAKETIIEHPIASVASVLPFVGELGEENALADTAAQYAKRAGQNAGIRALGGMRGQVGQLGAEGSRELAQSMIDQGVVAPMTGEIGMEKKIQDLLGQAGQTIGKYRQMPGAVPTAEEIEKALKDSLTAKYATGLHAGEQGGLEKAIEEVKKGPLTSFEDVANKATELNKFATKNKLVQPTNAATDVANALTGINESAMQKSLTPEQFAEYQKALPAYGEGKYAQAFAERGAQREATRRASGALSISPLNVLPQHLVNRLTAVLGSKIGDILASPLMGRYLPNLIEAAGKSQAALATTHELLKQKDPNYRSLISNQK
jgi:hypothetical protein